MDGIIFDLDGTLWDSTMVVVEAWNRGIAAFPGLDKVITLEELKGFMGLQIPEIGRRLFPQLSGGEQAAVFEKCTEMELAMLKERGGRLYPSVKEVLAQLAETHPLFIVSNCQEGYIETFLEYYGLAPFFTDFENPGRTGLTKGENIRLVMERNRLTSPIYVGDTQGDRNGSRFAEIPFVFAAYGFGEPDYYDYRISAFAELPALVTGIINGQGRGDKKP